MFVVSKELDLAQGRHKGGARMRLPFYLFLALAFLSTGTLLQFAEESSKIFGIVTVAQFFGFTGLVMAGFGVLEFAFHEVRRHWHRLR